MAITTQLIGKLGGGFKPISGIPITVQDKNTRTLVTAAKESYVILRWTRQSVAYLTVNGTLYRDPGVVGVRVKSGETVQWSSDATGSTLTINSAYLVEFPYDI